MPVLNTLTRLFKTQDHLILSSLIIRTLKYISLYNLHSHLVILLSTLTPSTLAQWCSQWERNRRTTECSPRDTDGHAPSHLLNCLTLLCQWRLSCFSRSNFTKKDSTFSWSCFYSTFLINVISSLLADYLNLPNKNVGSSVNNGTTLLTY